MPTVLALPTRPRFYGAGNDLPVGTFHIVALVGGGYTVARTIGVIRWYPLTAREDPTWHQCQTFEAAMARWIDDGTAALDWPHWGR